MLPESIKKLSKILTKIPNIGPKSAEKLALWFSGVGLMYSKELGHALSKLSTTIGVCPKCGYFSDGENQCCIYCLDSMRDSTVLCLVETNTDIIDIEESGAFKGHYFVLGGVISPLDGVTISNLPFDKLKQQVQDNKVQEIIIALGTTTEADVTTMYLKEFFQDTSVKIMLLGRGISVGTQIHYAGKKSIVEAFRIREQLE